MSFVVTSNRLPAIMAAMPERMTQVVRKVAADMKADVQQRAPIDTGNLRASAYFAKSSQFVYRVGTSAEYTLYVELGTSRMRAQPFLIPAWQAARYRMIQALNRMGPLS